MKSLEASVRIAVNASTQEARQQRPRVGDAAPLLWPLSLFLLCISNQVAGLVEKYTVNVSSLHLPLKRVEAGLSIQDRLCILRSSLELVC